MKNRMTAEELKEHLHEIKCDAIEFWKCKENVFPGLGRYERWRQCIRLVLEIWSMCESGRPPIRSYENSGVILVGFSKEAAR